MKKYSLVLLTILLISCGSKKTTQNIQDNLKQNLLSENDIFNKETVNNFLAKSDKTSQQESKRNFLSGVDQYRNRKQIDSAIISFKNSISLYPFAKTYYELGNAFMDKKDFNTAIEAYKMSETLEYKPYSLVLYNMCCAYSMLEKTKEALNYLQLAIENGYNNLDHIMSDEDLVFVRKDPNFNETVKTTMAGNTSTEAVSFFMYKSHFASLTLPYKLDEATSQTIDFDKSISYDYVDFVPGMVNSEFSREVGEEFYYVGKITETEKYAALLYSKAGIWSDKPPVHVYLTTYQFEKGEIIDFEKIAGLEYYSDSLRTAVVKNDMSIEVKYFIQEWEKNPDDYGYGSENKRTGLSQAEVKIFKIDVNGNIRETQKMIGSLR